MKFLLLVLLLCGAAPLAAQLRILGTVTDGISGEPLSGVRVAVADQRRGGYSAADGTFAVAAERRGDTLVLRLSLLSYADTALVVRPAQYDTIALGTIALRRAPISTSDVVVTASREEVKRRESAVPVSVVDRTAFERVAASCAFDIVRLSAGTQTETNCQTCGFTQVRLGGLDGPYTQMLIDGKPIFGPLQMLYGLEQLPEAAIERIEVVRGAASAMAGAGAMAGTVNVITRDLGAIPSSVRLDSRTMSGWRTDTRLVGSAATRIDSAALGIVATARLRDDWDANADGFSEVPAMRQFTSLLSGSVPLSPEWNLSVRGIVLAEDRNGGSDLALAPDLRRQTEFRSTAMFSGSVMAEWRPSSSFWVDTWLAGQSTSRTHFTGGVGDPGWGTTRSHTISAGAIANTLSAGTFADLRLSAGAEVFADDVDDRIPGYDYRIDASVAQLDGIAEVEAGGSFATVSAGVRMVGQSAMQGLHLVPRLSGIVRLGDWRLRGVWSLGLRPPPAFDPALHIAFAGGGLVLPRASQALLPERSASLAFSMDWERATEDWLLGAGVSVFGTSIRDAVALQFSGFEGDTRVVERVNSGTATSVALTAELRAVLRDAVECTLSYTLQRVRYRSGIVWSETAAPAFDGLRTPGSLGSLQMVFLPSSPLSVSVSAVLNGAMDVPHLAGPGTPEDRLFRSPATVDVAVWLRTSASVFSSAVSIEAGVDNIFNAFQNNFDSGVDRDSNFFWGPARPRTAGIRLGWTL